MSDPLAALYPSAKTATAEPTASGAATSDAASMLYGDTAPSNPPAAKPPAASAPRTEQSATEPPMAAKPETSAPPNSRAATAPDASTLYLDTPATQGQVDWNEAAATSASGLNLDFAPYDNGQPVTAEVQAERDRMADAFVAAGAGPTLAREVIADAARASRDTYQPITQDAAMTELQELWGDRFTEKVNSARELIQKAAAVNPDVIDYLERTQLGNDPKFIRKLATRAAAETRRAQEKRQTRRAIEG